MISITTRIMHKSGEWIEATTLLPIVKNDPQAFGSAFTYGRRYGLQALAGLPSVDDDAQSATIAMIEQNSKDQEALAMTEEKQADILKAAKDLDELILLWRDTPSKYKSALEPIKDEMKAKFEEKGE